MVASLKEIETLIDKLKPEDRAALLRYLLSSRKGITNPIMNSDATAAWGAFREVGNRLAKSDNGVSITEEITQMRR